MTGTATSPFSSEKPVFVLDEHIVRKHDETDEYGEDHELRFKSRDAESIYTLSLGLVEFRVGGKVNDTDKGTNVRFTASIHFPTIRKAQLEGSFITDGEPEHEEIEIIAGGLMAILANKKIKNSTL